MTCGNWSAPGKPAGHLAGGGVIINATENQSDLLVETEQISQERWASFLDEFTEMNEGTSCRVEVAGSPELGTQVLLDERPLLMVSLEEDEGVRQVIIECGDPADDGPASFRRVTPDPTALWVRKKEPHGWDALEIRTARSGTIILTIDPHPAH